MINSPEKKLLQHVLGVSAAELIKNKNIVMTDEQQLKYQALLQRYQNGEPLAYIIGEVGFVITSYSIHYTKLYENGMMIIQHKQDAYCHKQQSDCKKRIYLTNDLINRQ